MVSKKIHRGGHGGHCINCPKYGQLLRYPCMHVSILHTPLSFFHAPAPTKNKYPQTSEVSAPDRPTLHQLMMKSPQPQKCHISHKKKMSDSTDIELSNECD